MSFLKKYKKVVFLAIYVMAVFAVLYIFLCYHPTQEPIFDTEGSMYSNNMNNSRKVIIDTDGGPDDALAIMMLSKAANIDILGITCVSDMTTLENVGKNVLQTLEVAKNDTVPVFLGKDLFKEDKLKENSMLYGKDGMSDKGLIHPVKKVNKKSALDFIIDTIKSNPNEVEIVSLGPVSNIASVIKKEEKIISKIKKLWVLGSQGLGEGNVSPVAEYNVYTDVAAFDTILSTKEELFLLPYDTCIDTAIFDGTNLEDMSKKSEKAKYIVAAFETLREYNKLRLDNDQVCFCSAVLASTVINNKIITDEIFTYAQTVTNEGIAQGQVIFYRTGSICKDIKEKKPFCHLIIGENKELFTKMVYNVFDIV